MFGQVNARTNQNQLPKKLATDSLIIDMVFALCKTDEQYAKFRQCKERKPFVIHGLKFFNSHHCQATSIPRLPPLQATRVSRLTPDTRMQTQVWQEFGACSGMSPNQYFRQVIQQAAEIRLPNEVTSGMQSTIDTKDFIQKLQRQNKGLSASAVRLTCQQNPQTYPILTQIEICFTNNRFNQCQFEQRHHKDCGKRLMIVAQ